MNPTPKFWHFAGVYLNEDWPDEYGDECNALGAWIAECPGDLSALAVEMRYVLDEYQTEDELAVFVVSQGAAYLAAPQEGGYRGWLQRVLARLRSEINETDRRAVN